MTVLQNSLMTILVSTTLVDDEHIFGPEWQLVSDSLNFDYFRFQISNYSTELTLYIFIQSINN